MAAIEQAANEICVKLGIPGNLIKLFLIIL